jgi:hypothetical protein
MADRGKDSDRVIAKRAHRKLRGEVFKRAAELGLDVAGMGFYAVQAAVEEAEAAQGKGDGGEGDVVDLGKLKKAVLEGIADFLEVDLSDASNNAKRAAAIQASGKWPEDAEAQNTIINALE